MAGDRLSELPDDLLRRVLHFTPLKEAASTTALSRRWRAPLYLSSGGVNLETGVEIRYYCPPREGEARFFSCRESFDSAAAAALDAPKQVPVTRLTLRLKSDLHVRVGNSMTPWRDDTDQLVVSRYTALVDAVLSHRAARSIEVLRLDAEKRSCYYYCNLLSFYTVMLDALPSETLRVLELNKCSGLLHQSQAPAVVFPRLSSLRLSHSAQHLSSLQHAIDAAPALTVVRLEHVRIDATDEDSKEATTRRLRCPAATMLVMDSCRWLEEKQGRDRYSYSYETTVDVHGVEIDAKRLRRFMYKGPLLNFSFNPLPSELEQVDLDFPKDEYQGNNKDDPNRELDNFWRLARSFSNTKEMRLSLNHLEDIAVLSEARRVELLPAFHRLQRLGIQGVHWMKVKTATVMAILNLLRCCPVLSALRINLTAKDEDASNKEGRAPQKEIQIAAMLGPRHFYQCSQSSLTRVGLQFQFDKSDCLGFKLIKFFAENAMVLEEIRIDGADKKLSREMNLKTGKWNSRRRKLRATSFMVLPLKK